MKTLWTALLYFAGLLVLIGLPLYLSQKKAGIVSPISNILEKPLDKYTFANLRKTTFPKSQIKLEKIISQDELFTSRMFYFQVEGKKVSGIVNIPKANGTYPVIVLLRGFVDKKIYKPGIGSQPIGEELAKNGFVTLSPDFLGYGQSASGSADGFEDRFQTYTTALTLLASVDSLNTVGVSVDPKRVGIWGHSNGGHIAMAALTISGKPYPTVLWAPVSMPFPYSILYYTDEFDDHGKSLRKSLSNFEKEYNVEKYTFTNHLNLITAPIQLHQGTGDREVPYWWSEDLVNVLKEKKKDITYFVYAGDDHNLSLGGWSTAVLRSIAFFRENLLFVVQ